MPMKATDRAYLAGLFDGEGCIYIRSQNNSFSLAVSISQHVKNQALIHRVKRLWGGRCYHGKKHIALEWSGNKARPLLEAIFPYSCGEKKPQIRLALRFIERMPGNQGRKSTQNKSWMQRACDRMKQLKHRG